MSVFSSLRFFGFSSTFSTSSSISGYKSTPSPFFLPQESNGPVFNEEYDSMVRNCEVLVHFEIGNREHVGFTRSSWAIIFDFGGRNIKYELVDRTNGLISPIWMDLGRNSSILYKSTKVQFSYKKVRLLEKKNKKSYYNFRSEKSNRAQD